MLVFLYKQLEIIYRLYIILNQRDSNNTNNNNNNYNYRFISNMLHIGDLKSALQAIY